MRALQDRSKLEKCIAGKQSPYAITKKAKSECQSEENWRKSQVNENIRLLEQLTVLEETPWARNGEVLPKRPVSSINRSLFPLKAEEDLATDEIDTDA